MDFHCMDYRASVAQGPALSQVNADALVLVLTPEQSVTGDPALDSLIKDAVSAGDLTLKAGRTLYVHRPNGAKVTRVLLVVSGDDSAKSFKAAVLKGVAALKDLGVAHMAVAGALGLNLSCEHAHSLVLAVAEGTYVFRQTKPSAPK